MPNPAPGYAKHPNHSVVIEPGAVRVRVLVGSVPLADTTRALKLSESTLPVVWYAPMDDVDRSLLVRSDTSTYCPFKGHASYWHIRCGDEVIEDGLWAYETPYNECASLQNHVAFYPDKVTIRVDADY